MSQHTRGEVLSSVFLFQDWTSTQDFSHHAHTASLSAVASNNRYIATGSKDETIQLYDMKKKIEQGALLHHDGKLQMRESVFSQCAVL